MKLNEKEIRQWMSTGMSREGAIKEITFWINVERMPREEAIKEITFWINVERMLKNK